MRKLFVSLVFVMLIANLAWAAEQNAPTPRDKRTSPAARPAPAVAGVDSTYLIGPGDVLSISVWKDDALTKDVVVLPDGIISFPLIGLLKAGGKTVPQLKAEIEEKISQYVTEPVLNVEVKQVNSMLIFVIGRLNMEQREREVDPQRQRQCAPGPRHGRRPQHLRQEKQHQDFSPGRG